MKSKNLFAVAAIAVLVAAGTVSAQTACNCSQTTLIGTQANIRFANFPASTDWNGPVTGGPEFLSTNGAPWTWNPPHRFQIDVQASKVRIDFTTTGPATYGPGAQFKFTLNPLAPTPCGAASIVGSSVTTNRADAAPFVTSTSSFTGNSVTIAFVNQGFFADWNKGDWIEAQLTFACGTTTTSTSTCCPPVDKLMVQGMWGHQGNSASTYLQPLDTSSATTASFVNGLNAYLAYLHVVCPQTAKLKVEFFTGPVGPPVGSGPAGQLTGTDATIPKSTAWVPTLTVSGLNTALNAGMNNYVHTNGVWYRIAVRITGTNANGQTVNCGFNAPECAIDDTFAFTYNTAGKMAAGSSTAN
jgi:hypothetical protein